MKYGYNNVDLKRQNRGLVLRLLATGECTTRVETAKRIGLSKMAATNIIGQFLDEGVITEKEAIRVRGKGRNPIQLEIADTAPKLLGIYIYRDECSVVLCDICLKVLEKTGFQLTESTHDQWLSLLLASVEKMLEKAEELGERVFGIGVGSVGPVDRKNGLILNPTNFYGIKNVPIVDLLKENFSLPVGFDSLYNCAAITEKFYGNARDTEDFIFLGIGNGIGSGVVSNGRLLEDYSGFTSELGHNSIDYNGNLCSCGRRGCIETYVSAPVIRRRLQEATGEDRTFREFCLMAENSAPAEAEKVFLDMTEKLACILTNVTNFMNPQKIIVGHEGFWIPDRYLALLEERINEKKISGERLHLKVEKSAFGDDTHIRGCACSMIRKIFDGSILRRVP